MFINRIHPRVPLRLAPLLLELGELSPVVDLDEDLPHDDERDAGGHDGADDPEDDAEDVDHLGALLGLLHPHLQLPRLVVVAVHEGEPAAVLVQVRAQPLVLVDEVLGLLHDLHPVVEVEGALAALLHAPLVPDLVQRPGLEVLALDAGCELVTLAGAGGAVLAVLAAVLSCNITSSPSPSQVRTQIFGSQIERQCQQTLFLSISLTLLSLLALALPALAAAVAGAQLVDELAVGRDAGLVTGAALA